MAKKKDWQIPKRGKDGEWYPIVRIGSYVPFGYRESEDDRDWLIPIPEELELFDQAKEYLREYSSRVVANWLTKKSGRYISHVGLLKRVRKEESRRGGASQAREYQRRAEEAAKKAEKLENSLGGKNTRSYYGLKDGDSSSESEAGED